MTKAIEVITSVQRRRRWSRAEKERIVAAALAPGAIASEVARAAGIHTSQLFRWPQELCLPALWHLSCRQPAMDDRPHRAARLDGKRPRRLRDRSNRP